MTNNGNPNSRGVNGPAPSDVSDSGAETEVTLTTSIALGLLADERERFMLYLLKDRGGTVAVEELTVHLAAWENNTDPDLLTQETRRRVHNSLYHGVIPKLAEHGILLYDDDSDAVTLTEESQQLEPYLEFTKEQEAEQAEAFLDQCKRSGS